MTSMATQDRLCPSPAWRSWSTVSRRANCAAPNPCTNMPRTSVPCSSIRRSTGYSVEKPPGTSSTSINGGAMMPYLSSRISTCASERCSAVAVTVGTADHSPCMSTGICTATRARRRVRPTDTLRVAWELTADAMARTGVSALLVTAPCQTSDHRASSNWLFDQAVGRISPVSGSTDSVSGRHAARTSSASRSARNAPPAARTCRMASGSIRTDSNACPASSSGAVSPAVPSSCASSDRCPAASATAVLFSSSESAGWKAMRPGSLALVPAVFSPAHTTSPEASSSSSMAGW